MSPDEPPAQLAAAQHREGIAEFLELERLADTLGVGGVGDGGGGGGGSDSWRPQQATAQQKVRFMESLENIRAHNPQR